MSSRQALVAVALVLAIVAAWVFSGRATPRTAPIREEASAPRTVDVTQVHGRLLDAATEEGASARMTPAVALETARDVESVAADAAGFGTLVGHLYDSRYHTLGKHHLSIRNRKEHPHTQGFAVYTNRDGSFRFTQPIPAGDWWLYYGGDAKFATVVPRPIRETPICIRANETTSEEIVLVNDRAIFGTLQFRESEGFSVIVLLASEFAPETPLLEFSIANFPDKKSNGRFEIPAVEPGDYRLTYCLDTVDPAQRICVSETITVGTEHLELPPREISWATFGMIVTGEAVVERHK